MNDHAVQWIAPQPLWGRFAPEGEALNSAGALRADDQYRPALLRFASDDFMDRLLGLLAAAPAKLSTYLARPETWRSPMADGEDLVERAPLPQPARRLRRLSFGRSAPETVAAVPAAATDPLAQRLAVNAPRALPLKLYQAAHQRHYLVSAGLVCGRVGLPDKTVATGGRERVGFVMRRLLPATASSNTLVEHAYVKDAAGTRWQPAQPGQMSDAEELLPLFALSYADDTGRPRRMLAGMVPVGRREEYVGAATRPAQAPDPASVGLAPDSIAARKEQLKAELIEPWRNLIRNVFQTSQALAEGDQLASDNGGDASSIRKARIATLNPSLQMQSWLILLDFADYLRLHLPRVSAAVDAGSVAGLAGAEATLFATLKSLKMPAPQQAQLLAIQNRTIASDLGDALHRIRQSGVREALEGAQQLFSKNTLGLSWPGFYFSLAGLDGNGMPCGPYQGLTAPASLSAEDVDPRGGAASAAQANLDALDVLITQVCAALDRSAASDALAPPLPFAAELQRSLISSQHADDAGAFLIRCVYQRCDCGPLQPMLLSAPSQVFQLAGFYDPDAPARPIRIALPLDTTPAGLRKFKRNTAFQVSDVLCGQIARAKGMGFGDLVRSVLPWPLNKSLDGGDTAPCNSNGIQFGMICSLSIPIITICAFILLSIMIALFDLIFCWLPFFAICFPVPKLKGKAS